MIVHACVVRVVVAAIAILSAIRLLFMTTRGLHFGGAQPPSIKGGGLQPPCPPCSAASACLSKTVLQQIPERCGMQLRHGFFLLTSTGISNTTGIYAITRATRQFIIVMLWHLQIFIGRIYLFFLSYLLFPSIELIISLYQIS